MRAIALVGVVLIAIGLIALLLGGIPYTSKQTEVQVGPIAITARQQEKLLVSPLAGAMAVAGGVILVILGSRRR